MVWADLSPQAGHEQDGRRPVVILTTETYNTKAGLALICPVTNQAKDYPFEVTIPPTCGTTGVALADQVKSLDWRARRFVYKGTVPESVLDAILRAVRGLIG